MQFLQDLKDEIIILNITVARDFDIKNRFFGKITGRVRVIDGEVSQDRIVWVGDFAFDKDSRVLYDADKDEYDLRITPE